MKILFIFFFSVLFSSSVFAAPNETVVKEMARKTNIGMDDIRRYYNACDSGVTLSMKICASYRWITQDIRLNQIYQKSLVKAREMGYEVSLIRAQRNWLAYRDAACIYEGEMGAGGGTAEGLYVLSCKEDLTKERADRLDTGLRE